MKKTLCAVVLGLAGLLGAGQAAAVPVALELALLVDVSGSVDTNEYALQKQGYVNAFLNPTIQAAIAARSGGIAVSYIEWSGQSQQSQLVGWTHITDAASAIAFANLISGAPRAFSGNTAPGSALNFAVGLFSNNGFEGGRDVIDVSGDGSENEGANTAAARDAALAAGIETINGLPILGSETNLDLWYAANVQGGANSFTTVAASFATFDAAVAEKIGREITGVPEPATLTLLGLALAGLGFTRRKAA